MPHIYIPNRNLYKWFYKRLLDICTCEIDITLIIQMQILHPWFNQGHAGVIVDRHYNLVSSTRIFSALDISSMRLALSLVA